MDFIRMSHCLFKLFLLASYKIKSKLRPQSKDVLLLIIKLEKKKILLNNFSKAYIQELRKDFQFKQLLTNIDI